MAAFQLTSPRFTLAGVPVLMYHDVSDSPGSDKRYALVPSTFRDHLSFLRERGISVENLPTLVYSAERKSAVLTFDDGLSSSYESVFPALLNSGFHGTFFVTASLVDTPGYLTWSQIREMSDAGMSFGSHGDNHIDHSGLDGSEAYSQLRRSRLTLEDAVGKPVSCFSAPYGFLNRTVINAATQAGFQQICSSRPWLASSRSSVIPRLAIYRDTDVQRFSALVSRSALPLFARFARNAILHLPKQFLLRTWPKGLGLDANGSTQ